MLSKIITNDAQSAKNVTRKVQSCDSQSNQKSLYDKTCHGTNFPEYKYKVSTLM